MPHTLATMRNSSKETRRNRKQTLRDRIRKEVRRAGLTEQQAESLLKRIRVDFDELIEIGMVEGYQQGHNDAMQSVSPLPKGWNKHV